MITAATIHATGRSPFGERVSNDGWAVGEPTGRGRRGVTTTAPGGGVGMTVGRGTTFFSVGVTAGEGKRGVGLGAVSKPAVAGTICSTVGEGTDEGSF